MDKPRRDALVAVEMGLSSSHHYSLVPRFEQGGGSGGRGGRGKGRVEWW